MNYLTATAVGHLTAAPKFFEAAGEKEAMLAFTIAVNRGEDKVTYVECEMRGKNAVNVKPHLRQGKNVLAVGTPYATAYMPKEGNEPRASFKLSVYNLQLGADAKEKGDDPV